MIYYLQFSTTQICKEWNLDNPLPRCKVRILQELCFLRVNKKELYDANVWLGLILLTTVSSGVKIPLISF